MVFISVDCPDVMTKICRIKAVDGSEFVDLYYANQCIFFTTSSGVRDLFRAFVKPEEVTRATVSAFIAERYPPVYNPTAPASLQLFRRNNLTIVSADIHWFI